MTHSHAQAAAHTGGHARGHSHEGPGKRGHDHADKCGHDHPESFDDKAATWDDAEKTARAESVAATIASAVTLSADTRLLEYGAGTGLVAQFLAPSVGSVTLADPSAGMREVAAAKVASGVLPADTRLWALNLDTDPAPAEQFDVIAVVLALHHVADIPAVLRKLGAALAPDGRLCLVDLELEDGSFHDASDEIPHGFDEATLTGPLTTAGLVAEYRHGIYDVDKDGQAYPLFLAVCARA